MQIKRGAPVRGLKLFVHLPIPKIKMPISLYGGGGGTGNQLPTFDAESKSAKITNSLYGGGGAGHQLPKGKCKISEPKSQSEIYISGGEGGQFPTFDAESKFTKI